MRHRLILAAMPVLAVALAACTPMVETTQPTSSPTTARTPAPPIASATPAPTTDPILEQYAADTPADHAWPEQANAQNAEQVWACLWLDTAWASIDKGNRAEADRQVAHVYEASTLWSSDPPTFTTGPYARDWGWHGICTMLLGRMNYPVQGLYHWTP
jgi:hypothetical protein